MSSELESIIAELDEADAALTSRVEQLFGKVGLTDFSDEHAKLMDVHNRLKALLAVPELPKEGVPESPKEEAPVPGPEAA